MEGAPRSSGSPALIVGGFVAAVATMIGVWIGTKVVFWGVRRTRSAVRFGFAAATLRLYRRCPDCRGVIRGDARVCRHCGYRQ
jgi:hypothetical protein